MSFRSYSFANNNWSDLLYVQVDTVLFDETLNRFLDQKFWIQNIWAKHNKPALNWKNSKLEILTPIEVC